MHEPFPGFSPAAIEFLDGLRQDNSRDHFEVRRLVYESQVLAPARCLVPLVAAELRANVSPGVQADPRVGRSLFRINRDVRLSSDKTPYHPWVDVVWWEGDAPRQSPCFLFRLASDHLVVGAGLMGIPDHLLGRYRAAVDDPFTGQALVAAFDELEAAGTNVEVSVPTRERVPSPYPSDHPRGLLLRLDTIHASERLDIPAELGTASFPAWLAHQHMRFAPLHRWLVASLT